MKKLTLKGLARELCRREGKWQQVNIAQMSEIVRCLFDIAFVDDVEFRALMEAEMKDRSDHFVLGLINDAVKKKGSVKLPGKKRGRK